MALNDMGFPAGAFRIASLFDSGVRRPVAAYAADSPYSLIMLSRDTIHCLS